MKQTKKASREELRPVGKAPTTHAQQITILRNRGMIIDNEQEAEFYLQHINYYRMRGYWQSFEIDNKNHHFKPNSRFIDVLKIYIFDRELRLLVLDAIERFEVSVRSQFTYHLAHKHGAYAHLEETLMLDCDRGRKNVEKLKNHIEHSKETFIQHFKTSSINPPIWAVCEIMSLGLLSCFFANLRAMSTSNAIAATYGLPRNILRSWLYHLSEIRNICAHHSRLWNAKFNSKPKVPKAEQSQLLNQCQMDSAKIYNTLVILLYLMDVIAPKHHFRQRLRTLIDKHTALLSMMDFPSNWNKRSIWIARP